MWSLLAILVTCVGLAGCNDHGAAALTAIKTKVCACKTASCAEQEMQQVTKRTIDSNPRTQGIAHEMMDCLAKLQAGERPSTDPDEEGGAPGETAPGAAATGAAATGAAATTAAVPAAAPAAATTGAKPAAPAAAATRPATKKR